MNTGFQYHLNRQLTSGNFNRIFTTKNKLLEPNGIALFRTVSAKYGGKTYQQSGNMW